MPIIEYKPRDHERVAAIQLTEDTLEEAAAWCNGRIVEEIDPRDSNKVYKAINVPQKGGNERLSMGQVLLHRNNKFEVMGSRAFFTEFEEV